MTDISFQAADYPEIRRALFDLHTRILKNPNLDEIKTCAKHLGLWQHKTVSYKNDTELELLMDYRVYAYRPNGFNMAEKYLRLNKNSLSDYEQALLARMRLARYAVYQVEASNGTDAVTVADVFIKTRFTLVDQHLAKTATTGMVLASHLIDFGDFSIQSGALLPLNKALLHADEVVDALERIDDDHFADYLIDPANTAKLARAIISASIRLGHTESVKYQDV
ncbi:hypothetical protein QZJ86_12770 [Methylomonas montana]|uniref:hypothetical protein n=1 Tax=Methylomonas montana TaxID=3058963 RepID=UPI002657C14C|nr:hypothetical protein [Methylomonas montana]WKJ88894.1 hypothetical protein QZJ86_12770 [Methylomonas montana]